MMMRMPTHGMCVRQPTEELRQLIIRRGLDDEMPMIWHHRVGANGERLALVRFGQDAFKRIEVLGFFEQRQASDRAIQHVEASTSGTNSGAAWHTMIVTALCSKEKSCVPFSGPVCCRNNITERRKT